MSDYDAINATEVGAALLGWIAATSAMRHATPRGPIDYIAVEEGSAGALVRDFVACSTGHPGIVPGAADRMADLGAHLAADAVRSLGGAA